MNSEHEDWKLFEKAEVEWTPVPGSMAKSLDDGSFPLVETANSAGPVPMRGASMHAFKAFLWCLLFLFVSQLLPAVLVSLGFIAANATQLQPMMDDPVALELGLREIFNSPAYLKTVLPVNQASVILFSLAVLRWRLGRNWHRMIALRLPRWDHVVLVLVGMPALLVMIISLEPLASQYIPSPSWLRDPMREFIAKTGTWPALFAVLCIGVGPALGEELWVRGFLGRGLVGRYGYLGGILLSSFFFGFLHMEPRQATMAALLGIVLHFSYVATRSIFIPMLIHFLNNSLAILAISQTANFPLVNTLEDCYGRSGMLFLFSAGMVMATVGLGFYQGRIRQVSIDGLPMVDSVEIPDRSSDIVLVGEPIPPGTIVLIVMALAAFSSIWWNL